MFEQRTDWIEHWWHAHQPLVEVSLCHTAWFLLLVGSVFVFSILCISSQGIIMPRSSTPASGKFLTQAIPRLTAHTNGIWTPMEAKRGGRGGLTVDLLLCFVFLCQLLASKEAKSSLIFLSSTAPCSSHLNETMSMTTLFSPSSPCSLLYFPA